MQFPLLWCCFVGAALARAVDYAADRPHVDLGYASYEGMALSNGINQFLGMRYAAPPTGKRRFRRPEAPLRENHIQSAQKHAPLCYGVSNPNIPPIPLPYSEDCLFIDLYVPANASAKHGSGLPVMLWLQGGAFVQLFNPNYNGTGLIEAAGGNAIVATFNYRVGPYGFLANEELASEGNLNIGLHDQRAAIQWIHQHIASFGGDPNKVTLFGTSVGGGSVLLQLLAYGGQTPVHEASVKWSAGIAEAAYLPSTYSIGEMAFHYQALLQATNCADLACLRAVPIDQLQSANNAVPYPGQENAPLFGYGPVIDGSLLPAQPLTLLQKGQFSKDKPILLGTSRTEGTAFAPQANTTDEVYHFLKTQYPKLTKSTFANLNALYSNTPATLPGVTASLSPLFYRTAQLYGDASFSCPTLDFAQALGAHGVSTHFFIDHILDPVEVASGIIVPHTWELQAVWGPAYATQYVALPGANSYEPGGVNAAIVPVVQGYWTSFARTGGDPNALRASGSPVWQTVGAGLGRFLRLQTNATAMGTVDKEWANRCAAWRMVRGEIGQ